MSDVLYKPQNAWEKATQKEQIMAYCEGYKAFLNEGKTERKCVAQAVSMAEKAGFRPLESFDRLKAGDKVYLVNRKKSIVLAVIGSEPIRQGVNLVAAHIDSPRLDLKPVPLFEEANLAYFKTHYYGGIKKYQWTTIPLALYGTVVTQQGCIDVELGTEKDDYTFVITDLLPHLASDQMQKKLGQGIEGEHLNLLIGSIPADVEKEKVKTNVMNLLHEKYGIVEEDFISGEFEAVPAYQAKDIGLDRSMIGSYAHDDRVCAYTALSAILELDGLERSAVCLLADKEEVGSMGSTGTKSMFFENAIAELIARQESTYHDLMLRRALSGSKCLSADVSAAYDFAYDPSYERKNTPYLGYGLVLTKYTGARGKSGSNDASAEFTGEVRRLFKEKDVVWQTGELGKIDIGGGGTVAQYIANLNVDVIDCGVALLSMHAPYEVASKADVYMAYQGYKAFYGMK